MTSHACEKCSCLMWVLSENKPSMRILRTGTVDDQEFLDNLKPQKELFCSFRPAAIPEYPGIEHSDAM